MQNLNMEQIGKEVAAAMGNGWRSEFKPEWNHGVTLRKEEYRIWLRDNHDGRIEITESIDNKYHGYRDDWKPSQPGQPSERYSSVTCYAKADKGAAKIAKDILTKVVPQTIERTDNAVKRWKENNEQKERVKVLSEEIGKLHKHMEIRWDGDTGLQFKAYPYDRKIHEHVKVGNGLQYEINSRYERIEMKIEGLDLEQTKKLLAFLDTI